MIFRFSLQQLVGLVSLAGLACAALVQPGPGWLSAVVTLTLAILVFQVLRAALLRGQPRAAAIGWLVFALAYLALTVGPWLDAQVGPGLLSSKGLTYAQQQWRKESSDASSPESLQRLSLDWDFPFPLDKVNGSLSTSNTFFFTDLAIFANPFNPTPPTASAPVNCFRASGHWLWACLAGWLGSAIAVYFERRTAQRKRPAAT